jgi:cytochrome P450
MALATSAAANPHWIQGAKIGELQHIPGENGLPLIGTTFRVLRDPAAYGKHLARSYGQVARVNSFGNPGLAMAGAEANELVLFDRDKLFSSEQGWGPVLNLLFPRGLMLMDFDHHRIDRRALGAAFKPEPMRSYTQDMNTVFGQQLKNWTGTIKAFPAIKQLTLDVAASSFLGVPLGVEADKINNAFVDMVQASIGIIRRPWPGTAMGKGVAGRNYLNSYFLPQIAERRRDESRQDMFSQFCRATTEDGAYLSDQAIVDHMNFLMMAAHDTITSSMTSMFWWLAKEPEWQEKLREECLAIAPAGSDIAYGDLDKFTLTEYAFKEVLRLMTPVPSIPRRALRDFSFMGYDIPAGTGIFLSPAFVHKMEQYWDNPEKFDPMRFTPENVKGRHKYAWVGFGGGAHMCLGLHFAYMQIKILMHHLLTTKRISIEPGYSPQWQQWPMPKPKDGLTVTLTPL